MFFRCLSALAAAALPCSMMAQDVLCVCADPNNMPFSNERREGFENKLAELVAANLGAKLEYTWWSQRKAFIKNSLNDGRCDVLMGIPAGFASVAATIPYYRSSYVFVSRRDRGLHLSSLADPRLREWRIGIHVVGDDYAPPAAALARQGVTANIVGFSLFGEYGEQNPPRKLIDAVANGQIDVAIVWGPFAGYFARREASPLEIVPVSPAMFGGVPFTYQVSMATRRGDEALRDRLNRVIEFQAAAIQRILSEYEVPQVSEGGQ